ncbi:MULTISPECIES: BatD family protein [Legionella]|uniref:KQDN repeat-containing protein n=1 Tax=Legionella drozanskii LLAP-1 TaxID=1212489 RepID=A0A0W0SXE5_9GAMM|nr:MULTISPECIES: BatD family protein [Legionella]KTC88039.1 KQDN repeat-containing protein [Legionella drozanskii LLAP-1]PJE07359.1 MAG: protein BatD [Legionella sp.]
MKRLLLSLFLIGCNSIAFALVTLQVEAPQVQMGENFTLNLRIEGNQINSVPDLTPLQKDFTIVGTESNINYNIMNGKVRAVSEWTITLTPKRSGVLPIPALRIGQEKTNPISIEITQYPPSGNQPSTSKPGAMQQPQQQDVVLLADADVSQPFVNQQVIYTVKLFNSSRLLDANYLPPKVDDALFVPFGDGRRYQVTNNGRLYAVEEQQFALFPQKSGDLKINPPTFSALVYDLNGPRRVNVAAQPVVLKVQPIPAQNKGRNWLPAKQITLSESYDKNTSSLTEGNTLERKVTLQAVAVPAQLLPTLNFGSSDQFSIYPDKPIVNNSFKQQDLIGSSTVKVTYLLNKVGKVTIPPLNLPWFNTVTAKEEISSLPGFTINVVAAAGQHKPIPTSPAVVTTKPAQQLSPQPQDNKPLEKPTAKSHTSFAWWAAGGFAIAWLMTIIAWRRQRSTNPDKPSKGQALRQVQQACLSNNPRQARDAMLRWGRMQWPVANLLNLIDLENLVDDPVLKQQIHLLSQVLYHDNGAQKAWRGEPLWQAVSNFQRSSSSEKKDNNPLPPIHRL